MCFLTAPPQSLKLSDLDLLLRPPCYPAQYKDEYIRLLERFEVAIKQTAEEILIPSHLPAQQPDFQIPNGCECCVMLM